MGTLSVSSNHAYKALLTPILHTNGDQKVLKRGATNEGWRPICTLLRGQPSVFPVSTHYTEPGLEVVGYISGEA